MTDQATELEPTRCRCACCDGEFADFPDEEVSTRWTMPWASIGPSPVPTEDYLLICNECTAIMMQTNDVNRRPTMGKGR
jgi:hypothetical protein